LLGFGLIAVGLPVYLLMRRGLNRPAADHISAAVETRT
jgi:hypothetical protein